MGRRNKKIDLWGQLSVLNEKYKNDDAILGKEAIGFPRKTDASRLQMFNSHLDQRVNVNRCPDKPKIFGNYEDMIGNQSSFIHRAKANGVVEKIISKFPTEDGSLRAPFLVFLYYEEDDYYDVQPIDNVENLVEKYGFPYDNNKAMQLKEGQEVKKGEIINSPTCFDKFGNYGYGKNYLFMYQISDNVIEDAIEVSTDLASDSTSEHFFGSDEVYVVKVPINHNVILTNTYGDDDHWKCYPEIGEHTIKNQVCTSRVLANSQIFYDLKQINTRRRLSADKPTFVSGEVVDIDIYCNTPREEIPNTVFNEQFLRHLDCITRYYKEVYDYTQELIDAGCDVTHRIRVLNKDAKDYLDPEVKFKDENDRIFSHAVMYFTIKKETGVLKGQKITGRHGNKGVVAKVTPTYLMPHLETGRPIHIILEALGPVNRLNVMQLYEQSITFVCNRSIEHMQSHQLSLKEREAILWRILSIFDPEGEYIAVKNHYRTVCNTKKKKEEFFDIIYQYGIYVHVPPYWSGVNLYDALSKCYEEFEWLAPYRVFFYEPHSKRWVKMMNDLIIGEMYFIKLKQSSKKGLSARSTGPISRKGIPEKTDNAKKFQVPYSNIPVRRGKQEVENDMMSIDPEKIAKEQLAFRSSPLARKEVATRLMENYLGIDTFEPTKEMVNVNVQIFGVYLLMMGLEMRFEHDELDLSDTPGVKNHVYKNRRYYCTTEKMKEIVARDIANARYREQAPGALYFGPISSVENFLDDLTQTIKDDIIEYI